MMASSSAVITTSQEPSLMSFQEREALLLSWTMKSCSDNSSISLEEGWDILDRFGLKMIQAFLTGDDSAVKPIGTKAFTSLYTIAYKLSTTATVGVSDFSKVLYTRSIESVESFVELNIVSKLENKTGAEFLRLFAEGWMKHKLLTNWMWRLFMNLDKTVVRTEALPTITSCYLRCFYVKVFYCNLDKLRQSLLDCVAINREGPLVDNKVFKEVVQVFIVMGTASCHDYLVNLSEALDSPPDLIVYKTELEGHLIDDATKFYKEQSKSLWYDVDSVDDFAVYVRDAVESIGREEQLAVTCLHHTTTPKLIKACTKELVVNASKTINFYNKLVFCSLRESVMVASLVFSKEQECMLTEMYQLYHLTNQQHPENPAFYFFDSCARRFNEYIVSLGDEIIKTRSQQQMALRQQQSVKVVGRGSHPPASSATSSSVPSSYASNIAQQAAAICDDAVNEVTNSNPNNGDVITIASSADVGTSQCSMGPVKVLGLSADIPYPIPPSPLTRPPTADDVDSKFVEDSLRLYEHGCRLVHLFNNQQAFVAALKGAINTFVNRDSTSTDLSSSSSSFTAVTETREGQRSMIKRHRKQITGSRKLLGTKYRKRDVMGNIEEVNDIEDEDEDEDDVSGDSDLESDSDMNELGRSETETTESVLRPSKVARSVSWVGSGIRPVPGIGSGSTSGSSHIEGAGIVSSSSSSSSSATSSASASASSEAMDVSHPIATAASSSSFSSSSSASATTLSSTVSASQVAMLATYCDKLLKGGIKLDAGDLDGTLERCVLLFSHMSDKDLFAQLYRDSLSKRLLNNKSRSSDAERAVISKMRELCGGAYTSKLEGMLNDFILAESMNKDFEPRFLKWRMTAENVALRGITFGVQVLSSGHWPSQKMKDARLPPELDACRTFFLEWYGGIHSHRSLKWVLTLGEAVVCAQFGSRTYDLQVSTLQAVTLCVFDTCTSSLSYTALQQLTGITDTEVLKRLLHSLSCQKFKILLKSPPGRSVSQSDSFSVNQEFKHVLKKFRIPMAFLEDEQTVSKNIEVERGSAIDATIVRIMKARKVLSHAQLVGEILLQLAFFVPDPKLIKQRVEMLIEKEYLRRDSIDNKSYHYIP